MFILIWRHVTSWCSTFSKRILPLTRSRLAVPYRAYWCLTVAVCKHVCKRNEKYESLHRILATRTKCYTSKCRSFTWICGPSFSWTLFKKWRLYLKKISCWKCPVWNKQDVSGQQAGNPMFHAWQSLHHCRAPSCPEIPEISQMSWNCPEISNCPEILLIWSECPEIDLCYAGVTALPFYTLCLQVMTTIMLVTLSIK